MTPDFPFLLFAIFDVGFTLTVAGGLCEDNRLLN